MPYVAGVYIPKTEVITRNVEEYVGPLDPNFDYRTVALELASCQSPKPNVDELSMKWKQMMESMKPGILVTDDGGWPRMWWYEVHDVGMAAIWPYWKPRPCVFVRTTSYGPKWMDFTSIKDVRAKELT